MLGSQGAVDMAQQADLMGAVHDGHKALKATIALCLLRRTMWKASFWELPTCRIMCRHAAVHWPLKSCKLT